MTHLAPGDLVTYGEDPTRLRVTAVDGTRVELTDTTTGEPGIARTYELQLADAD